MIVSGEKTTAVIDTWCVFEVGASFWIPNFSTVHPFWHFYPQHTTCQLISCLQRRLTSTFFIIELVFCFEVAACFWYLLFRAWILCIQKLCVWTTGLMHQHWKEIYTFWGRTYLFLALMCPPWSMHTTCVPLLCAWNPGGTFSTEHFLWDCQSGWAGSGKCQLEPNLKYKTWA